MACAQVEPDKIVVKTRNQYQAVIFSASSKAGFTRVCFSPFDGNAEYLKWVSESVAPSKDECPSANAGRRRRSEMVRLTTTTDNVDATAKIMTAVEAVNSVSAIKQEQVTSYYMWKGELKNDAGDCVWPLR